MRSLCSSHFTTLRVSAILCCVHPDPSTLWILWCWHIHNAGLAARLWERKKLLSLARRSESERGCEVRKQDRASALRRPPPLSLEASAAARTSSLCAKGVGGVKSAFDRLNIYPNYKASAMKGMKETVCGAVLQLRWLFWPVSLDLVIAPSL